RDAAAECPNLLFFERIVGGDLKLEVDVGVVAAGFERDAEQAICQLRIDRSRAAGRKRRTKRRWKRRRHAGTLAAAPRSAPGRSGGLSRGYKLVDPLALSMVLASAMGFLDRLAPRKTPPIVSDPPIANYRVQLLLPRPTTLDPNAILHYLRTWREDVQ